MSREDPIGSSVQFSRSVVSDSRRPPESQHAWPPCPSPTPRVILSRSDQCDFNSGVSHKWASGPQMLHAAAAVISIMSDSL